MEYGHEHGWKTRENWTAIRHGSAKRCGYATRRAKTGTRRTALQQETAIWLRPEMEAQDDP
jgi:hypothetical protein